MHASSTSQEVSDRLVGSLLGDIHIDECVRVGKLACVYRGRRGSDRVAVKLYRADVPISASPERVRREQAAQKSVSHPCVARLIDAASAPDGSPYLVSEWISGTSFADRLAIGPIAWPALSAIVVSIARALAAIHAAGIVHRDVKPENVMLPAAGDPAAMLLDFGHALLVDEVRLTERGWTLGSASFMAPEQAAGQTLDGRADLYALGVLLYRSLTGVLPFVDASPAVVMDKHRHEPVVPPRERAPRADISAEAEDLTLWLMAKDPADRVPSARVLLHALRAL